MSEDHVVVGDIVTFQATQTPVSPFLSFTFSHGNGTIVSGATSVAKYASPGDYLVMLRWVSADAEGTLECGTVTVVGVGAAAFNPNAFVGLSEGEANSLASSHGLIARVARRDSVRFALTQDFRSDRINFEIDAGTVSLASLG